MEKCKKSLWLVLLSAFLGILTILSSCSERSEKRMGKIEGSSLYVSKVENLTDDFILGMDASCVPALERSGVRYYDFDGKEQDVYKVLADNGVNYIRVRIWNNPFDADGNGFGGGNCDIDNAVEIGKRATANGMKLLVNFHYSDFWADPSKQAAPLAWKDMEIEEKAQALYEYTRESLEKLKDAGIDIGMVQIGNETNGMFCGEKIWFNMQQLFAAGSKACREVVPEAKVALHFANPEKVTNYADYSKKLDYYKIDYDVFASSYYPYWHGTLDNLASVLSTVAETYGKEVMVMETSYAFTSDDSDFYGNTISDGGTVDKPFPYTVQGQANSVREVIDTVANKTKNGIGVVYWEGTCISVGGTSYEENLETWEKYGSGWASSFAKSYDPNDAGKYYGGNAVDNQAFFDSDGHPLESLRIFNLVKYGNTVDIKADAIEDASVIIDLNDDISFPDKVNAVMNDNSKQYVDVKWNTEDGLIERMKNGGVKKYEISGEASGMPAKLYVSMVEYNYLNNWSFEDDDIGNWVLHENGKADELYVEDKATDSLTGSRHYHFWSSAKDSVDFSLEQTVVLKPGTYRFSISIMGGDGGDTDIFAFVRKNGEIVSKDSMNITSYLNWDEGQVEFDVAEGDEIAVGISVKCSGSGNGAWGKIDDAMVNSTAG